jgi:hypothetical protein
MSTKSQHKVLSRAWFSLAPNGAVSLRNMSINFTGFRPVITRAAIAVFGYFCVHVRASGESSNGAIKEKKLIKKNIIKITRATTEGRCTSICY